MLLEVHRRRGSAFLVRNLPSIDHLAVLVQDKRGQDGRASVAVLLRVVEARFVVALELNRDLFAVLGPIHVGLSEGRLPE